MKKGIAFIVAAVLLLLSGCSVTALPEAEPYEYDPSAFPHAAPESGERVALLHEENLPEPGETVPDVAPEAYMEAVSLMCDDEYAAAAERLSGMGTYRNANYLLEICRGITEQDYDAAISAMQWVDALSTFTYDDEYSYQNYHLKSVFTDIFDDYRHEESVEGLNKMLEATYYARLADYDSARVVRDELSVDYSTDETYLTAFRNVTVSDWMDEELLANCKGEGTGKVLIAEKGAGSGNSCKVLLSDMVYALPVDRVPKSLDEVEYVLFIDDDYDTVGVYSNGAIGIRYKITLKVKQFPGGDVVYDSGLLIGDDPDDVVTVSGPIASVPGKLPDMTAAVAAIEDVLGLSYDD